MDLKKTVFLATIISSFSTNEALNRTSLSRLKLPTNKQLHADLMSNYGSKSVRPILNRSGPIEVRFAFVPSILASFDERKQHLSITGDLYMEWIDELLTWDPDDYGGINQISVRKEDMWIPDITCYERIDVGSSRLNIYDPYIIVNSSGHVTFFELTHLTVYCRVDMVLFPFDTQFCRIKFLSYTYDSDHVALVFENSTYTNEGIFKPNGVWKLVNMDVKEVVNPYTCCPNPYLEVDFTLELQRIGTFYIYSLGLPSALLSLLLLAAFLIHPNSGEKVSLCVSNVLAFVLFQQTVVENMPRSGEDSPVVVTYFSVMITVSCLSVLTSAYVLRAYHHTPEEPVPWFLRVVVKSRNKTKRKTRSHESRNKTNDLAFIQVPREAEDRHVIAPPSTVLGAASNQRKRSSASNVDDDGNNITTHALVSPFNEEFQSSDKAHRIKKNEEEWKLLALRLDKIFLLSVIVILIATICYCAIAFQLHAQISKDRREAGNDRTQK